MSSSEQILIIIPCRNEEGRIGNVVRGALSVMPGARILVVNDASKDSSSAEARSAGATVLTHSLHSGYGVALETGYRYAVRNGYRTVLQMDGDGQHSPEGLLSLREALEEHSADLVIGSRYNGDGAAAGSSTLIHLAHRIFGALLSPLVDERITDPTSGFQALGHRTLHFFASGLFPCDYPDADVILMASLAGLRIREVPVQMRARAAGKSMHSGLKPLYYGMKMSLSLLVVLLNFGLWRQWRRKHVANSIDGQRP